MNDEFIIKRKLMIDGEGIGDDRRLHLLQKMIVRWISTNYNSTEDYENMYNKICYQLSILEHSKYKSELVVKVNQNELLRYQQYQRELEENINNVNKAIELGKILLLEVKNMKHKKLQYKLITKDILAEPSREETKTYVQHLQQSLSKMKKTETNLNIEWSLCNKQFSVINVYLTKLRSVIDNSLVSIE